MPATRRMALMNLFLHNIGDFESDSFISPADSLISDTGLRVDYVVANPPFGKKSSMTFTNEEGEQDSNDLTYNRQDFWVTTSNKQLNFLQHIRTLLKSDGHAAVVLPDPDILAGEIIENLEAWIESFKEIYAASSSASLSRSVSSRRRSR